MQIVATIPKKSFIQETPNLLTDADSSPAAKKLLGFWTLRTSPRTQKKSHGKGTKSQSQSGTDIATTRPKRPKSQFGENTVNKAKFAK